jgi:hypothetical protein
MLFQNDGVGGFTDVAGGTPVAGLGQVLCAAWGDYDGDGDLDLFQSVQGGYSNALIRNEGEGVFTDVSAGTPFDTIGYFVLSADWGDFDNDGDLDLYAGAYGDSNSLYRNDEGGTFVEVASGTPIRNFGQASSVIWLDYDNDGYLDLYVCNSNTDSKLFRNDGLGLFSDVTDGLPLEATGYNAACVDYDSDGDLDLYVTNTASSNILMRNNLTGENHWLHVDLVGTMSNRAAIGARVRIVTGSLEQTREISGGGGSFSQNSLTAEFGVGSVSVVDMVEVSWPSGFVDIYTDVPADQRITLTELSTFARIVSVEDVPADQGGWARISFERSRYDDAGEISYPILHYAMHRRVDNPALLAQILDIGKQSVDDVGLARVDGREFRIIEGPDAAAPPGVWEVLGTVPARQQEDYIYLAPTLADSAETLTYSVYFIAAHTTTPSVYFDSSPDSGYSVDNIAPAIPPAFMAA